MDPEIQLRLRVLECTHCPLRTACTAPVPFRWHGEPENPLRVMIVGEAPGTKEDEAGRPFIGPSGALLEKWLKVLEVESAVITNVVHCRSHGPPRPDELRACKPHVLAEIEHFRPRVIIALGRTAQGVLKPESLSSVQPCSVLAIRHPSYYLRQGGRGWGPEICAAKVKLQEMLI